MSVNELRWVYRPAKNGCPAEYDLRQGRKVLLTIFRWPRKPWRLGYSLLPSAPGYDDFYVNLKAKTLSAAKREAYLVWRRHAKRELLALSRITLLRAPQ